MDSVALQGVYAPYVDSPSRHTNGRARSTTSAGDAPTAVKRRHDGTAVRDENRDHDADVARRAVQLALDRRDNGGSA